MRRSSIGWICALTLGLALGPAFAAGGTALQGSDANAIVDGIVAGTWDEGTICSKQTGGDATLVLTDTGGACDWHQILITFSVDSPGGVLIVDHDFEILTDCVDAGGEFLSLDLSFCPSPGPCTLQDLDNTSFDYGEVTISAVEVPNTVATGAGSNIPALGEWGAVIVGLGLLTMSVIFIVRRGGGRLES